MNCFFFFLDLLYWQVLSISSVYLIILYLTLSSAIVWAFTESAYKDASNVFVSAISIEQRISYAEQLVLIKTLLYLPQVL
jgi:hypothetical protein